MSIPILDEHGLLPMGTHDCTLDEIEASFCWNAHRIELFSKLKGFLKQHWHPLNIHAAMWVNGSFTRKKEKPEDIDLVADVSHLSTTEVTPLLVLFWRREELKRDFKVDFWLKHPLFPKDLTAFFCYTGIKAGAELGIDSQKIKGILKVNL